MVKVSSANLRRAAKELKKASTGIPFLDEFCKEHPEAGDHLLNLSSELSPHTVAGILIFWLALKYQMEEEQIKDLEALIRKE